jgi:hypothetical protein
MKYYNEKVFCIDLIVSEYKTDNVYKIIDLCKSILDIDITESEVKDYLQWEEDLEQANIEIRMNEFFKDCI